MKTLKIVLLCAVFACTLSNAFAQSINDISNLTAKSTELYREGKYIEAAQMLDKATKDVNRESPDYALMLWMVAQGYLAQDLYAKAEPLMRIYAEEKAIVVGKEHIDYAVSASALAYLYGRQGLYAKAEPLLIEIKNIYAKHRGGEFDLAYTSTLTGLAINYKVQGLFAKAEPLFIEAKEIITKVFNESIALRTAKAFDKQVKRIKFRAF